MGLWWNSNTISHSFVHRPFFRRRWANGVFSLYLSGLLGIPQSLWRARHLAHHAGRRCRLKCTRLLLAEIAVVSAIWTAMAWTSSTFWWTVYAPGYLLGLTLCAVHGHYEHRGGTTSHHGKLYNWLFFNDGYHVEHHASPGRHWSRLPQRVAAEGRRSRWPAVLRWLELFSLDGLERAVLGWGPIEQFLVARHERAIGRLLAGAGRIERVAIVGGGLLPRSVLAVRRVLPDARLAVIDASQENLDIARRYLTGPVEWIHAWYDRRRHSDVDLVVIPLAFVGDRQAIYRDPPAPAVLVHDWIWRRRGRGTIVSLLLLKRLNLVRP
ncbi:MAG: fatty acid desaturase [Pirellulales bacterium]